MRNFVRLFGDMADVGQIPSELWQIKPMTPFDTSPADLSFTDYDFPVNEDGSHVAIEAEVDCNISIDHSESIHPFFGFKSTGCIIDAK